MVLKQLKIKGNTILHIPILDGHRLDAGLKDLFLDLDIEDLAHGRCIHIPGKGFLIVTNPVIKNMLKGIFA